MVVLGLPGTLDDIEVWKMWFGGMTPYVQGVLLGAGGILVFMWIVSQLVDKWHRLARVFSRIYGWCLRMTVVRSRRSRIVCDMSELRGCLDEMPVGVYGRFIMLEHMFRIMDNLPGVVPGGGRPHSSIHS